MEVFKAPRAATRPSAASRGPSDLGSIFFPPDPALRCAWAGLSSPGPLARKQRAAQLSVHFSRQRLMSGFPAVRPGHPTPFEKRSAPPPWDLAERVLLARFGTGKLAITKTAASHGSLVWRRKEIRPALRRTMFHSLTDQKPRFHTTPPKCGKCLPHFGG